jgi:hypothetical protein
MTERTKQAWYIALISALEKIVTPSRPPKVHDFSQQPSSSFAFERTGENQASMTGQGRRVLRGDYILLQFGHKSALYQIQHVDYYSSPSDMWTALLLETDLPPKS